MHEQANIPKQPSILYCHCAHCDATAADVKREVLRGLCDSGVAFSAVGDLCRLAARCDSPLKDLARWEDLRIAACFPRAVRWLLPGMGADVRERISIANMRTDVPERIVKLLTIDGPRLASGPAVGDFPRIMLSGESGSPPVPPARKGEIITLLLENGCSVGCTGASVRPDESSDGEMHLSWSELTDPSDQQIVERVEDFRREGNLPDPDRWVPWFPVIDYDRCKGCGQCLNFCLFGTYVRTDSERIEVRNPSHCKTNCPACAKICPEAAIVFPKHPTGPINGDEVNGEDPTGGEVKVDLGELIDGDIYEALRRRGGAAERGLAQRMMELSEKLEIPPHVLKSLHKK